MKTINTPNTVPNFKSVTVGNYTAELMEFDGDYVLVKMVHGTPSNCKTVRTIPKKEYFELREKFDFSIPITDGGPVVRIV